MVQLHLKQEQDPLGKHPYGAAFRSLISHSGTWSPSTVWQSRGLGSTRGGRECSLRILGTLRPCCQRARSAFSWGSCEERAQPPGLLLLSLLNIWSMNGSREEGGKRACYSLVLGVFKALKEKEREECENREPGAHAGLRWPLSPSRWLHLMALCRGAP